MTVTFGDRRGQGGTIVPPYPCEKRVRTTRKGVVLSEWWYHVPCVECRMPRWIRRKDIAALRPCHGCAQTSKAKKAFKKSEKKLARHYDGATGALLWARMAKKYLDAHPTASELQFEKCLTGLPYAKNVILENCRHYWIVDFIVAGRIIIEINGGIHVLHAERDRRKYGEILQAGYALVVVEDGDVSDASIDWLWKGLG